MIAHLERGDALPHRGDHTGSFVAEDGRCGDLPFPGHHMQIRVTDPGGHHLHLDLVASGSVEVDLTYSYLPCSLEDGSSHRGHTAFRSVLFMFIGPRVSTGGGGTA